MIQTETVTINGLEYRHTYSDTGMMIEREGVQYEDAYDPADAARVYTETDTPIDDADATEADYIAALAEMGVKT